MIINCVNRSQRENAQPGKFFPFPTRVKFPHKKMTNDRWAKSIQKVAGRAS